MDIETLRGWIRQGHAVDYLFFWGHRQKREGNVEKLSQNPPMKSFLLSTGRRVLVEASPRDRIWGIGMGASNPDARDPVKWRGTNLLGFALMETRARLGGALGGPAS